MGLCAAAGAAPAATLDWDTVGWPGGVGSLFRTFSNVGGSGVNITVTVTNSTPASLVLSDSPDVNNDFTPPASSGNDFFLRTIGNPFGSGVTVDVVFGGAGVLGATGVSFGLFDVDNDPGTQWIDVLTLQANPVSGGSVRPTSVLPANGSPAWGYNALSGVITGTASAAENSNNGTALVNFATPITRFTIFYANGNSTAGSPAGNQWIGLGDIVFTPVPVPEPSSGALLGLGLLALAWYHPRRR